MLIVIPESPPGFCGLADHARVITAAIAQGGPSVHICHWRQARSCAPGRPVLLEYTPLAFSPFGLPWRLLVDVVLWRWRGSRVVTYVHELPFPNGPGWKRQLAVLAQRCHCMLLAAVSSAVVVNQSSGLGWLSLLCGRRRVSFLPTCSNVGEAAQVPPPQGRPLQVVVFGSPGKRRHAHALVASLGGYRRIFGDSVRVIDIGDPLPLPEALAMEVECLGTLPAAAVFAKLVESRYGFFYAEPQQFSKSGVFAAYCAAGVVPVIACRNANPSRHYLTMEAWLAGEANSEYSDRVFHECRRWANSFSVSKCAEKIRALTSPI